MKSIAVETATATPADLAKAARKEPIILTRNGRPVCAVVGLDEFAAEAWSLGSNPKFLELLNRSRQRLRDEGGLPLAEVRRRLGIQSRPKGRRSAKPKPSHRRTR